MSVTKILNETDLKVVIRKRSSIESKSKKAGEIKYDEVGIIYNDILFKKWDDLLMSLKKEFGPNRP
jgi:hypothetical protein